MKRVTRVAALLIMGGAFALSLPAWAQDLEPAAPESVGMTEQGLDALAQSMRGLVDEGRRAGVVWGVAKNGKLVQLEAYGRRDIERDLPMETDSAFRLYSMTRAVTAAAILTLVEEGKLDLDAPAANYIPEIADMQVISEIRGGKVAETVPQNPPMTVRHLFNYTSGLGYARNWPPGSEMDQRYILGLDTDLAGMIERLTRYPLIAQPGERWIYGFHSDVLGRIAEVVSGQPLDEFLDARLLEPIGLADTGFWLPYGEADRLAVVYRPGEDGSLVKTEAPPSSTYTEPGTFFSGGGGLVSTVPDYLRFTQMLLNGGELDGERVLKPGTVAEMGTNALTPAQGMVAPADNYNPSNLFAGYGWGLAIGVRLPEAIHTVPGSPGDLVWGGLANTVFFIDPTKQIVAVAMTQYLGPDAASLGFRLREGVYGALAD